MGSTRSRWLFGQGGHVLDGVPLEVADVAKASHSGFKVYTNDFATFSGALAEATSGGIILGGATGAATIVRPADTSKSTIRLTTQATAGGNGYLEFPGQWGYIAGKRLWCFMRFALSDVDDIQMMFGLATPGLTEPIGTPGAEGVWFDKTTDTDQDPNFNVRDASGTALANTALTGGNFLGADGTFYILGFTISATGVITPYYGTSIASMTAGTTVAASATELPDDAADELSLYASVQTGNGEADYMEIDYVVVCQEV